MKKRGVQVVACDLSQPQEELVKVLSRIDVVIFGN